MVFNFNITFPIVFNISSLFSGAIVIFSTDSCYKILSLFILSWSVSNFFPKNSHALWTTFSEEVLQLLVLLRQNFFIFYCRWGKYMPFKILLMWYVNLVLCAVECFGIAKLEFASFPFINKQCQINLIFYFQQPPIWSVNVMITSSNSVLLLFENTKLLASTFKT